eukprot:6740849-Prymnesium_polylepis.1
MMSSSTGCMISLVPGRPYERRLSMPKSRQVSGMNSVVPSFRWSARAGLCSYPFPTFSKTFEEICQPRIKRKCREM